MTTRIRAIARAEVQRHTRDGRVRIVAALVVALSLVALAGGFKRHADLHRVVALAQETTREQFLAQGAKNPHSAAHFGVYAFRPSAALSFVDRGVEDFVGVAIFVEPHKPNAFRDVPAADRIGLARFATWSMATMLQVLVPLLALLLAAPSIASERERGMLRLLMADGVRGFEIVLGKALAIAFVLGVVLLPSVLVVVGVFSSLAGELSFGRALFMAAGYALYLSVFVLMPLAFSAIARTARTATVLSIALWFATVIVIPRASAEVTRRAFPTPSTFAFRHAMEPQLWSGATWQVREEEVTAKALAAEGVSRVSDLKTNVNGLVLQAQEDEDARVFDRAYGALHRTFDEQDRALAYVSIAAPLLAVQAVSMSAAGTDNAHQVDFWLTTETYRRDMMRVLNDYITTHSTTSEGHAFKGDRDAWSLIPRFEYRPPAAGFAVSRAIGSASILVAWFVLSIALCFAAGRRLRPEVEA